MKLLRTLGISLALIIPSFALASSAPTASCCPGPCCEDGGCPMCPR